MSLESLERLRIGWCEALDRKAANAIADEIEREVAERCMQLPVDADGVPIRVGDLMVAIDETEVIGVGPDYYITGERIYEGQLRRDGWNLARNGRHRKDTWGRIIGDALDAGYRYGLASGRGEEPSDEVARAYAMGQYLERAEKLAEGSER